MPSTFFYTGLHPDLTAAHAASRRKLRPFLLLGYAAEVCSRSVRSRLPGSLRTEELGWVSRSRSLPADSPSVIYLYHCCTEAERLMWEACDVLVNAVFHISP